MKEPADLLLISSNRRRYLEKCLSRLLGGSSDFRLFCWDNGSSDGSAELIASLDDPRIEDRCLAPRNVRQREAFLWFLGRAKSDLVGKIDDDILLPEGWIERLAPLLRREPRFGMLGCWTFLAEDWDEKKAAHKIIELAGVPVFRNAWIGGTAFLARRDTISNYIKPAGTGYGLPIDQIIMSEDGLINGFPLPLLLAHHMGDPRSEHFQPELDGSLGETARRKGIASAARHAEWIAADAEEILREPLEAQLRRYRIHRDRSLRGQFRKLLMKLGRKLRSDRGGLSAAADF